MSEADVEVIRRAFRVMAETSWPSDPGATFDTWLAEGLCIAGAEWRASGSEGAIPGVDADYVGRDGYVEYTRSWTEEFGELEVDLEEVADGGAGRVVVIIHQRGSGRATGIPVERRTGFIVDFDDEHRVTVTTVYLEPSHALRAAGLPD